MKTKLAELLELPATATEADIIATITSWRDERRKIAASAAFEQRITDLRAITHMGREEAIACLQMQDTSTKAL